jgi:O-succinylbenzoate synthase
MPIAEVQLYRYRLPLTAPLQLKGETVSARTGVLVAIKDESGACGWGDVAPLPGFSAETLAEATDRLEAWARTCAGRPVPETWGDVAELAMEAPASVRFGVELAWADLMATRQNGMLPEIWTADPRSTVALNALLTGPPDAVLAEADRLVAEGYRAAKLKVGRRELPTEIELVRALTERHGPDLRLRLDANRAWSLDEARRFVAGIDPSTIDYLEEPLVDPSHLPELADTGCPVALDETMRDLSAGELDQHGYASAVVLKPSLVGGLAHTLRVARRAVELGMTPVVSAAYESGIGLRGLVALAASFPDNAPAGLDTYRRFQSDVVAPRLPLSEPAIDVAELMRTPIRLNPDTVEPLHSFASDS